MNCLAAETRSRHIPLPLRIVFRGLAKQAFEVGKKRSNLRRGGLNVTSGVVPELSTQGNLPCRPDRNRSQPSRLCAEPAIHQIGHMIVVADRHGKLDVRHVVIPGGIVEIPKTRVRSNPFAKQ
jgi:hypothetical protein